MITADALDAFFRSYLENELKGTAIEMITRRTEEGYELRFKHVSSGALMISNKRLESAKHPELTTIEAVGLVRQLKRMLIAAGNGELEQ